jgi:hypothetical protein
LSDTQTLGRKRVASGIVVEKTVERRQKRMIKNRESAARSRARRQVILFTLCVEWCFIFEVSLFCLIQGKIFVIGMDRLTHKNWNLKFRVWKKKMKGLGNRMYVSMPSSI